MVPVHSQNSHNTCINLHFIIIITGSPSALPLPSSLSDTGNVLCSPASMDGLILPRVFHTVFVKSIFSQHRRGIVTYALISADEEH